jgi:hypothetical protein
LKCFFLPYKLLQVQTPFITCNVIDHCIVNGLLPWDNVGRDSVVGIANSYGLDDRGVGVRVPVGPRIFSSPRRLDRLWGLPNLLFNGYRWLFSREQSGRGVKLTTHLQLVPRSRKCESIHLLPHTPSWRS